MGAPLAGSEVRAYVMTGGGVRFKGWWPRYRARRVQMIFPLKGTDKRGLVSLEAKKRKASRQLDKVGTHGVAQTLTRWLRTGASHCIQSSSSYMTKTQQALILCRESMASSYLQWMSPLQEEQNSDYFLMGMTNFTHVEAS